MISESILNMCSSRCPYCSRNGGHFFEYLTRRYHKCPYCSLIYKIPDNSNDRLLAHYRYNYFLKYLPTTTEKRREKLFDKILDLVEEKTCARSLLDIGTGCGYFMLRARERGWNVKGIDPSLNSVRVAKAKNKLDVFNGILEEYGTEEQFGVISFINSLDHITDPWKQIEASKKFIKAKGLILIRVPNGSIHPAINRLFSRLGMLECIKKFLVFHEYSFTPRFIKNLLSEKGFSDISVLCSPISGEFTVENHEKQILARVLQISIDAVASFVQLLTYGNILIGPSLLAIAKKN